MGLPEEGIQRLQQVSLKNWAFIVYGLQGLGMLTGVFWFAGVIVNVLLLEKVKTDPLIQAHFRYQMRTFAWALFFSVIGVLLTFIAVGFLVLFVVSIWAIYRIVRGLLRLSDDVVP